VIAMQEIQLFKKFLEIEMERQKAMQELSETLGIDVSFSNEEMLKNAQDSFVKAISQRINEDLQKALRI
tara:strand:+ start:101 stop:307 length:207 start_codon:yes stop_codon:yes gene_type:complete